MNAIYATFFIIFIRYCSFIEICFDSIEPSSGNIYTISQKMLYAQRIRCFFGSITFLCYVLFLIVAFDFGCYSVYMVI
jgi:hypothetical protein